MPLRCTNGLFMMDQQYDEYLTQNPFYTSLTKQCKQLFDKATDARWIICVPRLGSLGDKELTEEDFENHILKPEADEPVIYKTINNKSVIISKSVITTDTGFSVKREVPILFEETFFNKREESYRVLCISRPLEGSNDPVDDITDPALYSSCYHTAEEYAHLLWGTSASPKTRKLLANLLSDLQKLLGQLSCPSLKQLQDVSQTYFNKALAILMRDPHTKELSLCDQAFDDNLKLAIENHLMYSIHKQLFPILCTCLATKDACLNKITRNLSHIQLQHLGVRIEFCQNVPLARKELSNFTLHRTPSGKIRCIKKTVAALIKSRNAKHPELDRPLALTTDDLLPILVFLVIKSDVTNWWAHFQHMTAFKFSCTNNDNEYGFYLATLEAALEHVSIGTLLDEKLTDSIDAKKVPEEEGSLTLWQKQDGATVGIEHLFQLVKDNNKAGVLEVLQKSKSLQTQTNLGTSSSVIKSLCHPLCTCDKCLSVLQTDSQLEASHVSVHSRDARGYTVLHMAAFYGHTDIADVALQQGALVNGADYLNQTPLHIACKRGHQTVTLLLLHNGAMFNSKDSSGNTPLHLATAHGHDQCAKALVFFDQGSGHLILDAANDFGDTPLHLASKWGFYSIVKLLLENGASALIKNKKHHDALKYAHNENIAKLIEEAIVKETHSPKMKKSQTFHTDLTLKNSKDQRSISEKQATLSRSLTENGLYQKTHNSRKHKSPPSSIRHLSDKTDKECLRTDRKMEKLLKAVSNGDVNMTKFHLGWLTDSDEEGSDLDLSQQQLCHPLCQCEKCQPLQKFTTASSRSGLHVNSQDYHGNTPLHVAAHNGQVAIVELLLRHGADINAYTHDQGTTPMHLACRQPSTEVLQCLVEREADVNAQDSEGNSPLHYCCVMGNKEQAKVLLKHGAKVNLANKKGNTSLHEAVRWNFLHLVELLLQNGAVVNQTNVDGKLPIHYVQTEKMSNVLQHRCSVKKSLDREPAVASKLSIPQQCSSKNSAFMSDTLDDASDQSQVTFTRINKPS